MCGRANKIAQVQFAHMLFVQAVVHTTEDYCLMCTCMHLLCVLTSLIFHAHIGFVTSDFKNLSSHVVAMFKLSGTNYRDQYIEISMYVCTL